MRKAIFHLRRQVHYFRSIPISQWMAPMLLFILLLACHSESVSPNGITGNNPGALFLTFSTNAQTLPTSVTSTSNQVKLEVDHGTDVTKLTPQFTIPAGYTAYIKNVAQVSGSTVVDFSKPVTYDLKDPANGSTQWTVTVTPLGCRVVIDASHDGGVWWYPQSEATGFDASAVHQGKAFADMLRNKGLEVTELGRGKELTEEMFFGHFVVIRAGGFEAYTTKELNVYTKLIDRGMNLVFFTDHKQYDPIDELGDLLGLKMEGVAFGKVTTFGVHKITANLTTIDYNAGSILTNGNQNPNITILGWLGPSDYGDLNFNNTKDTDEPLAPPVMGIVHYKKSQVFFIGDMNGIQVRPQPFIDNLIGWMGSCF